MSILLYPTAMLHTARRVGAAASTAASIRSVKAQTTPSFPGKSFAQPFRGKRNIGLVGIDVERFREKVDHFVEHFASHQDSGLHGRVFSAAS